MSNTVFVIDTDVLYTRYGGVLMEACKSFRSANTEIHERIVHVLNIWGRISMQLDFQKAIESTLSAEHRAIQEATLEVLAGKLKSAWTRLDGLLKKPEVPKPNKDLFDVKRLKYAYTKTSLDECISDLQQWQTIFDPSWFLILRQHSHIVDQQLESHLLVNVVKIAAKMRDALFSHQTISQGLSLPAGALDYTHAEEVVYSKAKFLPRPKSTKWVVLDSIPYNGTDRDILTKNVRSLATKFSNADPSVFNILTCRDFVKSPGGSSGTGTLNLVFDIPTSHNERPRSLWRHLIERTSHNLTDRVAFARQVANAVSFVHTLGYVHKNVRPENLIEFGYTESNLGSLYLIGFEQVRLADGRTYRQGDAMRSKDLYRYPDRQGASPIEDYCMQHDIYGLRVCLLEIGLWDSFLACDADGSGTAHPAKALCVDAEVFHQQTPSAVKDHLVHLAETQLPLSMGTMSKDVVVNCLTCLDDDNIDFGNRAEFEDEDGVLVGVRYIQKVSELYILMKITVVPADECPDLAEAK